MTPEIDRWQEEIHRDPEAWPGETFLKYLPRIAAFKREVGAETVLDYGCGKAIYHPRGWDILGYDPYVLRFSQRPADQSDLVTCIDVLEHVPRERLAAVRADLFRFARRGLFISVCCRPAERAFPDGSNVHVTIRPPNWWRRWIECCPVPYKIHCETKQ